MNVEELVSNAGGTLTAIAKKPVKVKGMSKKLLLGMIDCVFDGKQYEYRSTWNEDEDVDAFLENNNVSKSARDMIGGVLTLFFSMQEVYSHV